MKNHEAQILPIARKQTEKLQEWCKDFQGFFGWRVKVTEEDSRMLIDVIANEFDYRISAQGDHLWSVLDHKEDGRSCDLSAGYFDFDMFAQIMMDILYWESPLRRRGSYSVPVPNRPKKQEMEKNLTCRLTCDKNQPT